MSVSILIGDAREKLRELPDVSVHCCVTSPPYFGLRDYGCEGQMGLEPTPDEYVAGMVALFREVRRVLRDDGTLWLNIGDSYSGSGPSGASYQSKTTLERQGKAKDGNFRISQRLEPRGLTYAEKKPVPAAGTKAKDLIGIPWMLAFALRADGWYLRQDIIWSKPNPMPESVRDRCTKAHEYLFLLSKGPRYYYDAEAIAEASTDKSPGNVSHKGLTAYDAGDEKHRTKAGLVAYAERKRQAGKQHKQEALGQHLGGYLGSNDAYDKRNKRSVWEVATQPFSEAHFATYPPALIEPCILAGCPVGGTVLDPFFGAGTTGLVADRLGRNCIGIELNPEYAEIAERRLTGDAGMFAEVKAA